MEGRGCGTCWGAGEVATGADDWKHSVVTKVPETRQVDTINDSELIADSCALLCLLIILESLHPKRCLFCNKHGTFAPAWKVYVHVVWCIPDESIILNDMSLATFLYRQCHHFTVYFYIMIGSKTTFEAIVNSFKIQSIMSLD